MGGRSGVSIAPVATKGESGALMRSVAGTDAVTRTIPGRQAAAPRQTARLQWAFAQGSVAAAGCIPAMSAQGMSVAACAEEMLASASWAAATGATTPASTIAAMTSRWTAGRQSLRSDMRESYPLHAERRRAPVGGPAPFAS